MVKRTVRFFEVLNKAKSRHPNQLPFDDLVAAVRDLPDEAAYVSAPRMELLGSTFLPPSRPGARPMVPFIALDRITRDIRMRIERRRHYRPLVLGDDETLAEPTFYSIFNRNVLAVMRNSGAAPGSASFRDYLNKLDLISGGVEVVPLADRNVLRALRDVDTLTKLDVAVGPTVTADIFDQTSLIHGVLRHFRQQLGTVGIEVAVRISPKGQHEASDAALSEMMSIATSDALGFVDKAAINYRSLEEYLVEPGTGVDLLGRLPLADRRSVYTDMLQLATIFGGFGGVIFSVYLGMQGRRIRTIKQHVGVPLLRVWLFALTVPWVSAVMLIIARILDRGAIRSENFARWIAVAALALVVLQLVRSLWVFYQLAAIDLQGDAPTIKTSQNPVRVNRHPAS